MKATEQEHQAGARKIFARVLPAIILMKLFILVRREPEPVRGRDMRNALVG